MHKYNTKPEPSDISSPEQLDKDFFKNALENGLHEQNIEIWRFRFLPARGDVHCSQVYRVYVHYSKNLGSGTFVTVKVMPHNEGLDLPAMKSMFIKEKWLTTEILPQFEILLDDIRFAPRCYYATSSPLQTIVLEDTEELGFQLVSIEARLDERHAKLAIKKLGQFHGASMVFSKRRPSMMIHYSKGLIDPEAINPQTSIYKMFHKHLEFEIKLASQLEDFEEITEKLQEFYDNFESRILMCQKPPRDGGKIKVLNHGDFWLNNLLFNYDSRNSPVEVLFEDFQFPIYGSPGLDLNYFLFTSVRLEVMRRWKRLLEVYYASLKDTLEKLHYNDIPSYANIEREFKFNSAFGFFGLIQSMTSISMEKTLNDENYFEILAESESEAEDAKRVDCVSDKLVAHFKFSLLELDRLGAFDK